MSSLVSLVANVKIYDFFTAIYIDPTTNLHLNLQFFAGRMCFRGDRKSRRSSQSSSSNFPSLSGVFTFRMSGAFPSE
jgi:hypothetical protein